MHKVYQQQHLKWRGDARFGDSAEAVHGTKLQWTLVILLPNLFFSLEISRDVVRDPTYFSLKLLGEVHNPSSAVCQRRSKISSGPGIIMFPAIESSLPQCQEHRTQRSRSKLREEVHLKPDANPNPDSHPHPSPYPLFLTSILTPVHGGHEKPSRSKRAKKQKMIEKLRRRKKGALMTTGCTITNARGAAGVLSLTPNDSLRTCGVKLYSGRSLRNVGGADGQK